jgi:8-oxo-dGTP pyrophosphatase MutT (NUDIX family)
VGGPGVLEWSVRLGADEEATRKLVVAAVREVFEECGVLFASADEDGPLVEVSSPQWQQVRAGLVARELSLSDVLREHGLCLRTDLLRAHAHWVTPVCEPRRFDTRFFVALMPAGRAIDGATSEADHAGWFDPASVLADYAAGSAVVLPPTLVCLEDLAASPSAAEFFAQEPVIRRIMPELVVNDAGEAVMRTDFAGTKAPRG